LFAVVRSKIFAVKIRSDPDLSGSEIMSLGQEQGTETAGAEALAETIEDGVAGAEGVFTGDDAPAVLARTEGVVEAGVAGFVAFFVETGADAPATEVVETFAEFVGAVVVTAFGVAATTGVFPITITAFVIVLPQTPQPSSTLAVIAYVPGGTPLRSHCTFEPKPTMRPAETT